MLVNHKQTTKLVGVFVAAFERLLILDNATLHKLFSKRSEVVPVIFSLVFLK